MVEQATWNQGILSARPSGSRYAECPASGILPLDLGRGRDGLVYVPDSAASEDGAPLVIMLHGAGASASDVMPMVKECAEAHSAVVLAPDSKGASWDMIQRGFGPDVAFLDRALARLFQSHAIAPDRIAIAGFSDGASYALSLGLINGDLFSDILAFSLGFVHATRNRDSPRIFISHGREDPVLPIDRCGRRVAAALDRAGHDVAYREFTGGHVVPVEMVAAAFDRFLGR